MTADDLARRRTQYETAGFDVSDAAADPLEQFQRWFAAVDDLVPEPHAMVLATATAGGDPGARTVLLRGAGADGLRFFTNLESAKGRALAENPRAEAVFLWMPVHRQVRVHGVVRVLPDAEADAYFASRPRGSQIGAWASPQSRPVADRSTLDALVADIERRFDGVEIPRPAHWGGYRLVPDCWEFWQGRPNRLHDRIRYRSVDGAWVLERVAP